MRRRDFTKLAALAIPGMSLTFQACRSHAATLDDTLASPESLSLFLDRNALREVGKAFRASTPAEDDRQKLTALLMTDGMGRQLSPNTSLSAIRSALENQVSRDFSQGNTVIVKGWVLAATEARQCALHTIIHP
jgi:hypothetical protein